MTLYHITQVDHCELIDRQLASLRFVQTTAGVHVEHAAAEEVVAGGGGGGEEGGAHEHGDVEGAGDRAGGDGASAGAGGSIEAEYRDFWGAGWDARLAPDHHGRFRVPFVCCYPQLSLI